MKRIVADNTVRLGLVQLQAAGTIDTIPSGAGLFITAAGANGTDPTLGANLARITPKAGVTGDGCTLNGNAYDCLLTSAWQRFGGVFDVPSDCKNLIVMVWTNAQFAATNGFALVQVSLTDGMELQDFSPQEVSAELTRIQRYYAKTFNVDTNPVQNAGINTGEAKGIAGKAIAVANSGIIPIRYPTSMRAQPTNTLYNPAAANALMRNLTGAADMGATAITLGGEQGSVVIATGVAATAVGDQVGIHASFDAEL